VTEAVLDNPTRHRFELELDGHMALSEYTLAPGVITFVHTVVPPELEGRGVASRLMKAALDQVRARGLKVVAKCPFVAAFIAKHADYRNLLV